MLWALDSFLEPLRAYCDALKKLRLLHSKRGGAAPVTILLPSPEDMDLFEGSGKRCVLGPVYGRFPACNRFGFLRCPARGGRPWIARGEVQGAECSDHLAAEAG